MKNLKNIIIIAIIIIAAFAVYSFFFTGKQDAALSQSAPSKDENVDQDLITLLLQLKAIKLDDSFFSNITFKSLQDFSQELVPEATGRTNPFAPLGTASTPPPPKK